MSDAVITSAGVQEKAAGGFRAWPIAVLAPLVLVAPWLLLCQLFRAPAEVSTVRFLLLVLLLATATVTDFLRRRIYNWTTYTVLGWAVLVELLGTVLDNAAEEKAGLSSKATAWLGALPWHDSLLGFAAGFALMFVLYNIFRGGAGDLKLVAVLGALVGINRVIEILIYSYLLAGVFAACLVVGVAGPGPLLASAARSIGLDFSGGKASSSVRDCLKRQVPMAPFIAAGTLLALIWA